MGVSNMLRRDRWMVSGLIVAALASTIGGGICQAAETAKPARLEQIPGSDLKRVVLTPKAAQRLAIKTAKVREKPVLRWLTAGGVVEAMKEDLPATTAAVTGPAGASTASDAAPIRVRVPLLDPDRMTGQAFPGSSLGASAKGRKADDDDDDDDNGKDQTKGKDDGEHKSKSRDIPTTVIVVPIGGEYGAKSWRAIPIDVAPGTDASDTGRYYVVNGKNHDLRPGQRVFVRLSQPASGTPQKVIPYSAVIYDPSGNTWTYTNPEPLVFVRHRIEVESIEDGRAVLKEGPAAGTVVVTAGAAELMGVEQKFGH